MDVRDGYEAPRVTDLGDLPELTQAMQHDGAEDGSGKGGTGHSDPMP